MPTALCYQHWRTTNDTNGNPRRLYLVFSAGGNAREPQGTWSSVLEVIEEGYSGWPQSLRDLPELMPVNIPPAEYRRIKKWAKETGIYRGA